MPVRAALFLLAIAPTLTGCEKLSRVHQCRTLGATVAQAMDAIQAANKANRPADYRAASKRYLDLAKSTREVHFSRPSGQAALEEYAAALESVAAPVAAYADALEREHRRDQSENRREIERSGRRAEAAAGRIDAFCRGP